MFAHPYARRTNGGGYGEVLNFLPVRVKQQWGGYMLLYMPLCYLCSGMWCIRAYIHELHRLYLGLQSDKFKNVHIADGEAHHPDSLETICHHG